MSRAHAEEAAMGGSPATLKQQESGPEAAPGRPPAMSEIIIRDQTTGSKMSETELQEILRYYFAQQIPKPTAKDVELAFNDQDELLNQTQDLLERSCAAWARHNAPHLVVGIKEDEHRAIELTKWLDMLLVRASVFNTITKNEAKTVARTLREMRNSATHRSRLPIPTILSMLRSAQLFTSAMGDEETSQIFTGVGQSLQALATSNTTITSTTTTTQGFSSQVPQSQKIRHEQVRIAMDSIRKAIRRMQEQIPKVSKIDAKDLIQQLKQHGQSPRVKQQFGMPPSQPISSMGSRPRKRRRIEVEEEPAEFVGIAPARFFAPAVPTTIRQPSISGQSFLAQAQAAAAGIGVASDNVKEEN